MRVAVLSDWWMPEIVGGAEVSSAGATNQLARKHEVKVFTVGNPKRNVRLENNIDLRYSRGLILRKQVNTKLVVKVLEKIRVVFDVVTPMVFTSKLVKSKPKVIVIHQIDRIGIYVIPLLKAFLPKVPIVRVFHDLSDTCSIRSRFRNDTVCKRTCLGCLPKQTFHKTIANRFYDATVTNSHFTEEKLKTLGFRLFQNKIGYPFSPGELELGKVEKPCNLEFEKNFYEIGFVGRVNHEKGVEQIIQSLSGRDTNYRLHLVGRVESSYKNFLIKVSKDLKVKIVFYDFIEKPYEELFIKISTLVVASITEESFGLIPIEAAEHGIPCIVSKLGGLLEAASFIEPPPLSFDPENVQELGESLDSRRPLRILLVNLPIDLSMGSTINKVVDSFNLKES